MGSTKAATGDSPRAIASREATHRLPGVNRGQMKGTAARVAPISSGETTRWHLTRWSCAGTVLHGCKNLDAKARASFLVVDDER